MMSNPNKIVGDYVIRPRIIGRGNFSTIYEGYHQQFNKQVAVKKLDVEDTQKLKKYVQSEIDLHQKLVHQHIVSMYDHYIDHEINSIYIFMEYCPKGDFTNFQQKRPMMEWAINKYMRQFVSALEYIHNSGIFHRDLKPHNLLLDAEYNLKVSDFGLSKNEIESEVTVLHKTYCGSPLYMAPEIIFESIYDNKSDLWSVGVILYEWITGQHPYKCKNLYELMTKMKSEAFTLPLIYKSTLPHSLIRLLDGLMNKNPVQRIEWSELFKHPWILKDQQLTIENELIEFPDGIFTFPKLGEHNKLKYIFVEDYMRSKSENDKILCSPLVKKELSHTYALQPPPITVDPLDDFTGIMEESPKERHINLSQSSSSEEETENIAETLKDAIMTVQQPIPPMPANLAKPTKPININNQRHLHYNFNLESPSFRAKSIHEIKRTSSGISSINAGTSTSSTSTPDSISNSLKNIVYTIWNNITDRNNV